MRSIKPAHLIISGLILLVNIHYISCTKSNSVDIHSNGTSTVGNPLAPASEKLLSSLCEVVERCHNEVNLTECRNGVLNTTGFSEVLGLPTRFTTYASILQAEESGILRGDLTQSSSCQSSIQERNCTDPLVVGAYNPALSNPYSNMPQLISQPSCTQALVPKIKLEVPIEMIDQGIASKTTPLAFSRSTTSLNSLDYDGDPIYSLELVGYNSDTITKTISLVNSTGTVIAAISMNPSGSSYNPIRSSTTFTLPDGNDTYRLQLEGTAVEGQLAIYEARIRIRQTAATKTRIYIPLMAGVTRQANTSDDQTNSGYLDVSTNANFSQPNFGWYTLWTKNSAAFSQLAETRPWTFAAILNNSAGETVTASLFNATTGMGITESEVATNSMSPTLIQTSFSNSAANFTEGQNMEVRFKTNNGFGYIYKAGLWVTLVNLNHAEVYFRTLLAVNWNAGNTAQNIAHHRLAFDGSFFPEGSSVLHELHSSAEANSTCSAAVFDNGASDIDFTGALIDNSVLSISGTSLRRQRSSALSLQNGHRYSAYLSDSVGPGACVVTSSFMVVSF